MTLKRRIQRLEGKHCGDPDAVRVIVREIVWADGTLLSFHGEALTSTGWQTVTDGASVGREAFEHRLWGMVEGGASGAGTVPHRR